MGWNLSKKKRMLYNLDSISAPLSIICSNVYSTEDIAINLKGNEQLEKQILNEIMTLQFKKNAGALDLVSIIGNYECIFKGAVVFGSVWIPLEINSICSKTGRDLLIDIFITKNPGMYNK